MTNPMRIAESGPLSQVPRCGARTTSGAPCKSPRSPVGDGAECTAARTAVARREGATNGNNYKHGRYTAEVVTNRRWLKDAIRLLRTIRQ